MKSSSFSPGRVIFHGPTCTPKMLHSLHEKSMGDEVMEVEAGRTSREIE